MTSPRSLEERLKEYQVMLEGLTPQIRGVIGLTRHAARDKEEIQALHELEGAAASYEIIARDIGKLLAGEELKPFIAEFEIPFPE